MSFRPSILVALRTFFSLTLATAGAIAPSAVLAESDAPAEQTTTSDAPQATEVPPAPPPQQPGAYGQPATTYVPNGYAQPMQVQLQYATPEPPPPPPANLITINPLPLLFGELQLGYERAVTPHVSLSFDLAALVWDGVFRVMWNADDNTHMAGAGLSFAPRFFVFGEAPRGFWLAPKVVFAYARAWNDYAAADGFGISALATLGYTWIFSHFVLSIGGGGGVSYVTALASSGDSSVSIDGVKPVFDLRVALGYAF